MKSKLKDKKVIIIICIVVILLAVGGSSLYFFVFRKQPAPSLYWDEKEGISSITEIVGERKWEMEEGEKKVTYVYSEIGNSKDDMEKYLAYLEKKGFQDIRIPKAEDDADEEKAGGKKHYELGADSAKKGKLLKITINVKKDSYTIKTQKKKGTLEKALQAVDEEEIKLDNAHTSEEALAKVQEMGMDKLGIEAAPEKLSFIPYGARIVIEGREYYNIRVYENGQSGAVYYEGSYLVDCRTVQRIYKYEECTQECEKLE